MSDFKNIIEFLRLKRRSDEVEANQIPENNVLLRDIQNDKNQYANKNSFETDHTRYKRIFQVLEDYDAKFIYLREILSETEYFVKTSLGKYRNIINGNLEIISPDQLYEIPLDNTSSYIYDSEIKRVFIVFNSINGVIIFADTIKYDPKSKYLNEITSSTYTYDYKEPLTTYGKIMEFVFAHFKNFIRNAVKKVIVVKSEIPAIINLIPFLQYEPSFGNYILKYRYYDKNNLQKFYLPEEESAITLKFLSSGGLLSFLTETLFSQGFSMEEDAGKDPVRNFFRNQFIEQIIDKTEEDFLSRGKNVYSSVMETIFFLPEEIVAKFSDRFFWLLLELMMNRDNFQNTKNLAEENIFVKIIRTILQKENQEIKLMTWFLETIKDGDKNITKFEFIYNRINGDNFIEFTKLVNQAWKKSRFLIPDNEKNIEFLTTDGEFALPYSSEKTLGFYFSNIELSFQTDKQRGRLLKVICDTGRTEVQMSPGNDTDILVPTPVRIIEEYWYHPFYPIYLKDISSQETNLKLDSVIPAFMLKANEDKQFWNNVITTAEYALDIITTISGVGNIAKFRYLAKFASKASKLPFVSKIGRTVIAARKAVAITAGVIEITSGVVNTLLKLTGVKDTNWGRALSEYLFWLELLSLSGELTLAIHNGLRKSAKEILEHEDDIRKTAKNIDEAKEIDEALMQLKREGGSGGYSKIATTKELEKKAFKQLEKKFLNKIIENPFEKIKEVMPLFNHISVGDAIVQISRYNCGNTAKVVVDFFKTGKISRAEPSGMQDLIEVAAKFEKGNFIPATLPRMKEILQEGQIIVIYGVTNIQSYVNKRGIKIGETIEGHYFVGVKKNKELHLFDGQTGEDAIFENTNKFTEFIGSKYNKRYTSKEGGGFSYIIVNN